MGCGSSREPVRLHEKEGDSVPLERVKQLSLPNVSERYMATADMVLILDSGVGVLCHSQILALHSTVICNMLTDLAGEHPGRIKFPLPEFTETQCSALLAWLYSSTPSKGAAFEGHDAAAHDAAVVVARFAHKYDAPHALRHVAAYLTAFMDAKFASCGVNPLTSKGSCTLNELRTWAVMADKFDLRELCGHCERTLLFNWENIQDGPTSFDRLSRGALRRVAKGLHATLLAERSAGATGGLKYPPASDFIAWRQAT